jgi:hypothetical protein
MTEKSGYIKSRKVGSKTSHMDIPMEGFGIEDKDEEHEKKDENDDNVQNKEDELVVNMRMPSILDIHRSSQVYFTSYIRTLTLTSTPTFALSLFDPP